MSLIDRHTLLVQQLFVRHEGSLRGFVLAFSPSVSDAEDVMQNTFLVITRKAADFDLDSNFLAWARSVARYEILSIRRKRSLTLSAEIMEKLEANCPDDFATERKVAALASCIEKLPPKAREITRLRYHQNIGPAEIASTLARSVNSINVALSKVRASLRDCIDQRLASEDSA